MTNNVTRLPVPAHLEPKNASRTLLVSVRSYFYSLYNSNDAKFREHLSSVGNKDSITKNRWFDRHVAVGLIKKAAADAKDWNTANADDGDIYSAITKVMRDHPQLNLKLRRRDYNLLTRPQAAE